MNIKEYLSLDATSLASLICQGSITATDALDAALARADAVNPIINAVVLPPVDYARQRAGEMCRDGPFDGVPFLLKDMTVDIEGWPMTSGCAVFRNYIARQTTELGRRFEDAGLVLFGRTASPELGFSTDTVSSLYGVTRNPWDRCLSAGGSSGGSAAAVAAGIVPAAHAGDGGGSIRIPSALCGVFGMKPSRGRNPTGPNHPEGLFGMVSNHVMSRTVRDSAALLDVAARADVGAPYLAPATVRPYAEEALSEPTSLCIAVQLTSYTGVTVAPECVAAVEDVARLCAILGHKVEIVDIRVDAQQIRDVFEVLFCTLANVVVGTRAASIGREIREGDCEPVTMELVHRSHQLSSADCMKTWYLAHSMAREFSRKIQKFDLILSPTSIQAKKQIGFPSLIHSDVDSYFEHLFADVSFTAIFNIAGLPAMSVPLHWGEDGLPVGVHFGAQFGREDMLFQLAGQLERARPWVHHYARCMP